MTSHGYTPEPPERAWAILALSIALVVLVFAFFGAGLWFIELLSGPKADALYTPTRSENDYIIGFCLAFLMLQVFFGVRLVTELLWLELSRLWKRISR